LGDFGGAGTLNVQGSATLNAGQLYVGKGFTRATTDGSQPYSAPGFGVVNQTGGTVNVGNFLSLGSNNTTSSGTYNLAGGTLNASDIVRGTGAGTFNFNGGTLQPSGSNANFMSGLTAANVQAGGARIDTNGFDIAIGQPLLGASGDGGLTKRGVGTLTMTGANSFTGPTLVNAGTLAFSTNPSTIGALTIADGAGLRVQAAQGGPTVTASSLTLGTSSPTSLTFDLLQSSSAVPLISVQAFAVNGTVNTAIVNGGALLSGVYKLVDYTSFAGAGTLAGSPYTLGPRSTATLVNNGTNALNLYVVADRPIWTGADNTTWANGLNGTLKNWKLQNSGAATDYLQGDNVLFDDSAVGSTDVSISGASVSPAAVTFNNSTKNYTVGGSFGITGGGFLVKNGTGSVTLSTANSYTGGTNINAGVLSVSADNDLGAAGSAVVLNGGTLRTTAGITNSHAISVGTNGATINVANTNQYFFNTTDALTGNGPLNVTGRGTVAGTGFGNLRLDHTNTFSGPITMSAGGNFEYGTNGAVASGATFTLANEGELAVQGGNTTTMPNAVVVSGGTNSILSFENGTAGVVSGPIAMNANLTIALRDWYNYATVRGGTISGIMSGAGALAINSGTGSGGMLTLSGANTFTGNISVNSAIVNAGNGQNTGAPRTAGPLGNAATAGRTVTINNGGTVAFTVGNVLAGGGDTTGPALSFIVNRGGTLATAANDIGGGGGGDANVFGNMTLNGGTFTTGNGYSANYQAAILLGNFTFGGPLRRSTPTRRTRLPTASCSGGRRPARTTSHSMCPT
jgi:autotransporter-associated beta strand protein